MSDKLNLKLFNKYLICHADGSPLKGKKYFVLRLDSDDPAESVRVAAAMSAYKGETVGNPAKLRKALEYLLKERDILDFCHNNLGSKTREDWDKVYKVLRKIIEKAMRALAAPPRNCDRFTSAEEAWDAYDEWVESYRANGEIPPFNEFGWLFAQANESEVE